jgi:hypothetical protein
MSRDRPSLQDRIRSRQQSGFVGRQVQIVQYRENLRLPVDDDDRRFLFNIHGDAGVGKTYLTRQLLQIAASEGALTAYTDETAQDVTSAMTAIAADLRCGGVQLAEFEKRAAAYQQAPLPGQQAHYRRAAYPGHPHSVGPAADVAGHPGRGPPSRRSRHRRPDR